MYLSVCLFLFLHFCELNVFNNLPPGLRRPGLSFDSFRHALKSQLLGDWSA